MQTIDGRGLPDAAAALRFFCKDTEKFKIKRVLVYFFTP